MKPLFTVSMFFLFSFAMIAVLWTDARGEEFEAEFATPPARYGSAPFWSWNEKLEPVEMVRQIDELHAQGMGGFFIHAREGLITRYLSGDWMNAVRISVDRAKALGMIVYLYDEDRWPSGFASGKVPAMNPEFREQALIMVKSDAPLAADEIEAEWKLVRVFEADIKDNEILFYKNVTPAAGTSVSAPGQGRSMLYFFHVYAKSSEWFNNETYIDTLSPDAVDAFIQVTHEAYKKVIGDEFGKTVPAIFTDEPALQMQGLFPPQALPWTAALPDTFTQKYGYDIRDELPLLYYDGDVSPKARFDFWTNATEMFREAFAHRIFDWCAKNGIALTGHYMSEDTLQSQIMWTGASMPHYEYMQRPGMDHLGRNINDALTARQVSSVAHQFDRPLVLTELYGCTGWNVSLENMKWIADWHYVNGVNFMNEHLSWYTMRGQRKRDYPASIHYQSPWWKDFHVLANYLTRATFTNSSGKYVADTLVIHPISSAWAAYSPINKKKVEALNAQFTSLVDTLNARHVDYDLGDELIIERHGAVRGGKFIVNKMEYTSVFVPNGDVLRDSTIKLLEQFIAQGGVVVSMQQPEILIDAVKPAAVLPGAARANSADEAFDKLQPHLTHHIAFEPDRGAAEPVLIHQRRIGNSYFIFFANTDQNAAHDVVATLPYSGRVREWNLFDGTSRDIASTQTILQIRVALHFEPAGSVLLSVNPDEPAAEIKPENMQLIKEQSIPDEWKIVSRDANALTLDMVRYRRAEDVNFTPSVHTLAAQNAVDARGPGLPFSLRYAFKSAIDPGVVSELFIVLEQPDRYEIAFNGNAAAYNGNGWWKDQQFKRIDIKSMAVKGKNDLEINGTYQNPKQPDTRTYTENGIEIESVYVVGDFYVAQKKNEFMIVPSNDKFRYGDMAEHGYPFFSGTMRIAQDVNIAPADGEKIFVEIKGLEAITARVYVNGVEAGFIGFHPHSVDVTKFVKSGANRIEIELTNSNRNLMGPHHAEVREPLNVGPGTFANLININTYFLIPFGITEGVSVAYYK